MFSDVVWKYKNADMLTPLLKNENINSGVRTVKKRLRNVSGEAL